MGILQFWSRKKRHTPTSSVASSSSSVSPQRPTYSEASSSSSASPQRPRYSLAEIRSATYDFSPGFLLGEGSFGKVYKGLMDEEHRAVAAKRRDPRSSQGRREFDEETGILFQIRHKNIVSLYGYCDEADELILVYEYVDNHSLKHHLKLARDGGPSLTWHDRITILIGAARGLHHLHDGFPGSSIIHRDVKSSNILLDVHLVPKVSDFGLAKHVDLDKSHVSTLVKGSDGYIDPSYMSSNGKLTKKSDVFAFGVVVLEVLSGRLAHDRSRADGEWHLFDWALNREARDIVDPNVTGNISEYSLNKCFEVAKSCLKVDPTQRPTMSRVLVMLQSALDGLESGSPQEYHINDQVGPNSLLEEAPVDGSNSLLEEAPEVEPNSLLEEAPEVESNSLLEEAPEVESNSLLEEAPEVGPNTLLEEAPEVEQPAVEMPLQVDNASGTHVRGVSLVDLDVMTDNYDMNHWIAHGSRGSFVYRGVLRRTGKEAAIKWHSNKKLTDQAFDEQISTLLSLNHENVVKLLGYCVDDDKQILLYEFASGRSLQDILHGRHDINGCYIEAGPTVSWAQRIAIAIDIANGLCYIHDLELIHHNIKSSNVLLFDDGTAKIADLHLSNPCSCNLPIPIHAERPACELHHPPEFERDGDSNEGDVYSLGIVLLELLTGKTLVDTTLPEGLNLVTWATPHLNKQSVHTIVDAALEHYPQVAVVKDIGT